jgi:hypothetical protein
MSRYKRPAMTVKNRNPMIHMVFSLRLILDDRLTSNMAVMMNTAPNVRLANKRYSPTGLCMSLYHMDKNENPIKAKKVDFNIFSEYVFIRVFIVSQ